MKICVFFRLKKKSKEVIEIKNKNPISNQFGCFMIHSEILHWLKNSEASSKKWMNHRYMGSVIGKKKTKKENGKIIKDANGTNNKL